MILQISISKSISLPLYNYTQLATARHYRDRKLTWVKRKGGGFDENLTEENKKFLDEHVLDTYRQLKSPLKDGPWTRGEWKENEMNKRTGTLGIKLGSLPQWTKDGRLFYTTLIQILDNHVIDYMSPEECMKKNDKLKDQSKQGRLGRLIIGALSTDPRMFTPQYLKLFENCGLPPKRKLTSFMISPHAALKPGTPLYAAHYRVGDYVDVGAFTTGYGFQGAMKKYGFKGGPRSHGATKFHRKRGTVNSGRQRSRVIKGTKMPGKMGGVYRNQYSLKVWRINNKSNIIYVHGPTIPGPSHCFVRIRDSLHTDKYKEPLSLKNHPPFPTYFMDDNAKKLDLDEEVFDKALHQFKEPTINFDNFQVKKIVKREGAKLAKIKS